MVDYATVNIKSLLMLVKGHITILYKISIDLGLDVENRSLIV